MTTIKKKPQNKKLKRSDITDEMRRAVGACEHDQINYKTLEKLANSQYERAKLDTKTIKFQQKIINDFKKANKILVDKYEDALEALENELQECHKDKNDITRAYNGLHSMGKFAEEQGIDIKKACKDLPENKHKYHFKQKHSLLESGKVSHEYFFGKKKILEFPILKKKEAN